MEQRWPFVDRLRGDRVLEIGPTPTPDGQPRVAALMELTFEQGHFGRELARSPESGAWEQALIVQTTAKVHVNEPIAVDAFAVNLPVGTRVSDAIRGSVDHIGEDHPPRWGRRYESRESLAGL